MKIIKFMRLLPIVQSVVLYNYLLLFFTSSQANEPPDIHVLMNWIKALEERQEPSVSDIKKIVIQYAFRQTCDFD